MKKSQEKFLNYINLIVVILGLTATIINYKYGVNGGVIKYLTMATVAIFISRYIKNLLGIFILHAINLLFLYRLYADGLKLDMYSSVFLKFKYMLLIIILIIFGILLTSISKKLIIWSVLFLSLHVLVFIEAITNATWQRFWDPMVVNYTIRQYFSVILLIFLIVFLLSLQNKVQESRKKY